MSKTGFVYKLLLIPCSITKIIFTVLFMFGVLPFKMADSFCVFSIPFTFASFYDEQFVDKFGLIFAILLFLTPLLWLLSLVLLFFKHKKVLATACIILIPLCLLDIVCAVWSICLGDLQDFKIVNIIFSLFIVIVSALYIGKLKSFEKQNERF